MERYTLTEDTGYEGIHAWNFNDFGSAIKCKNLASYKEINFKNKGLIPHFIPSFPSPNINRPLCHALFTDNLTSLKSHQVSYQFHQTFSC